MTKSWEKFIEKNIYKDDILSIVEDILYNNISSYHVVKLKWYENYYRIRKWKIRVVFIKNSCENEIVAIDTRWWIYKGLSK